ncbi:magnesium transporter [Ehrlichia ruminantium]|uniref:Magnesium transporter MgtE n=2 Tax=Ehrlichia ruminantium TaxID=779 RepID=A0A0H3M8F3_EHRRW|nr:magnesium transporter [Ehrlichia ruminantium]KYW97900.1 magnesium transporter [Ehrlichia ruminantium]QLK50537.1 magnesium transporter [Ehrlichia ruminantium]QLK51462.1 magnesium transporter [Ehrlichia ruminantium]QLK53297.1 magnesium transporter [Ehrlichia ruminantium]QLK55137.1 magnesium transporter [Ehrlichia ruminantium]
MSMSEIDHTLHYILDEKISNSLTQALETQNYEVIQEIINESDNVQLAYFLLTSTYQHRKELLNNINDNLIKDILIHLVPDLRQEIIKILGIEKVASLISQLNTEDIVVIIEDLDKESQLSIINVLSKRNKIFVNELLSYPEESAGRLMHKDVIIAPEYWTINQLLYFLTQNNKINKEFYEIFIVDPKLNPIGYLRLDNIICANKSQVIKDLMKTDIKIITSHTTQEEVAEIFRKYSLLSAPVINKEGRIIGSIIVHDILNVIHQEAEKDVLHLGMVSNNDISSSLLKTVIKRLPWLIVNLLTATVSSMIIGIFSNTLQHFIALSIIMPTIASMSGNAGLQSLAVTIRALSTKQLTHRNAYRLLFKELCVGSINGLILAIIASIVLILRGQDTEIQILAGTSMIITFSIATFLGTAIPMLLNFFKVDPAISSSIIICATSDTLSFLIFLGMATIFLL